MVKAGKIIDKLLKYINENGPQSNIDLCKELLSDSFVKAVKEENFYKIPLNEINDILCMYLQTEGEHDTNSISELISKVSLIDPNGGFLLLNSVKLEKPTIEECNKIISSASGCQIFKQLYELLSKEIKQKNEENEKLKKENTSDVFVELPNGEKKYFDLPKETTIRKLKSLILEDYGEPRPEVSSLLIKSKASTLQDDALISGEWRKQGNTLNIVDESGNIKIYVKPSTGKLINLGCNQNDLIEKIKAKIQETENIPPAQQKLTFRGKVLNEGNTLKDYGVTNESHVYLHFMQISNTSRNVSKNDLITIGVRTLTGSHIQLLCNENDHIEDIKARLQDKTGINQDQQRLIFEGRPLEDGNDLKDYGIADGSTLRLFLILRG